MLSSLSVSPKSYLPASSLDCDRRLSVAVQDGLALSIRRQSIGDGRATVMVSLGDELAHCAVNYSGAREVSDDLFGEAVEFVMTRFGSLGVSEIREAFRLAAAGELGDVDMKAYYGQFTIVILGAVLTAYVLYRRRVVAAIERAEAEQREAERDAARSQDWDERAWAEQRLSVLREKVRAGSLTYGDLTSTDYETFERVGLFTPDRETKKKAWAESEAGVKAVVAGDILAGLDVRGALAALDRNPGDYKAKRIRWSQQRVLHDWLVSSTALMRLV